MQLTESQVDSPVSLENVEHKVGRYMKPLTSQWIEEVTQFCPGVKIVLVGEYAGCLGRSGY
jgi:hypothetical protein